MDNIWHTIVTKDEEVTMTYAIFLSPDKNWDVVLTFLPAGWEEKAKELGALLRCRGFADAEALLRTLLIHLAAGCSLRETRHGESPSQGAYGR